MGGGLGEDAVHDNAGGEEAVRAGSESSLMGHWGLNDGVILCNHESKKRNHGTFGNRGCVR